MLSDEEKKAIEKIRSFNQYNWEMNNLKEKKIAKPYFDALDTILNLIKKQSKEIEELKENKYGLEEEVQIQAKQLIEIDGNYICKEESEQKEKKAYIDGTNVAHELCNKYWKDKIKAKIEEKILEVKGLYERGVQPQAQYTMKLLRDLEKSLLEKEQI